ncbi:MAG: xylose isomerase [Verrucomicrobia bacterium]|nr:xylose isomerase [Verrucomicrobiota bacterium]
MNEIGVMASLKADVPTLKYVSDFGLKVCQVVSWDQTKFNDEFADRLRAESRELGVRISSFWAGYPGPAVWNFVDGPVTLGLIPREHREIRVAALKKAGNFAKRAGIPAVVTHLGFIPENPKDPVFGEVVEAVKDIALHLKSQGIEFWFETGQETPVTLLRLIQVVGTGNLGINLDPANLILYGKASPVDSLDVFGKYVKGIHAKDGMYPTDPMKLGHEVKVGAGKVRFPELVKGLKEAGYEGDYIIEREIKGDQQKKDIEETIEYLKKLIEEKWE